MGIESINSNLNVNAGSFSNYKSNVDVPSSPEAPEIEKPELQDVQLKFVLASIWSNRKGSYTCLLDILLLLVWIGVHHSR